MREPVIGEKYVRIKGRGSTTTSLIGQVYTAEESGFPRTYRFRSVSTGKCSYYKLSEWESFMTPQDSKSVLRDWVSKVDEAYHAHHSRS